MKEKPSVLIDNHIEKIDIEFPSTSLISHQALVKLNNAMLRSTNKFHKKIRTIPQNFTHTYLEKLTYDKATYVVIFGFGKISKPTWDYVRYEIDTNSLMKDLQPELIKEK